MQPGAIQDLLGNQADTFAVENLSAMDAPEKKPAVHCLGLVDGERRVGSDPFSGRVRSHVKHG